MLCLHCGKEENLYYCENCIQELITQNAKLQLRIKELEEMLKYKPKHFNEQDLKEYEKWLFNPEHIPRIN